MSDSRLSGSRPFVIVGAGQAGRWLALTLREQGYSGRIVWCGDEAHRPYERPPLSKAALKGDLALAQIALLDDARFAALDLDWRPGTPITAIDRAAQCVHTASGERLPYARLFLALGGRPRTLPGVAPHPRLCLLRTWDDAQALKARLASARRVLVLGGGWIGLEVAASARRLGLQVTLLEAAPRLCARTMPPVVSSHLQALHLAEGVHLRLGTAVAQVAADDAGVQVTLADGERLDADLLVIGIGLLPNDALASAAGLATGNGVFTDAQGRTADPAVFAVGDVANTLQADGSRLRLESWDNAQRQAVAAARAALGLAPDPAADTPPWFWSDQYDDNLQVLGQPLARHAVVQRDEPARRARMIFFCDGATVRAVAAVNAGRDLRIVRKWMAQGRFPTLQALAEAGTDLNRLPLHAPA